MKVFVNNYDYEDERLYSTGDYELDELLERAFCDGYYFAQKEYGNNFLQKVGTGIKKV